MPKRIKSFSLVLGLGLLCGSAFAAVDPQDSRETVTITGTSVDTLTADLDPMKDHWDGVTGDEISRDIDPVDRSSAFRAFAQGLSGPLNQFYDWHGFHDDGLFIPTRQFAEAGSLCRDFSEETKHHGTEGLDPQINTDSRPPMIFGTACRERDGWHFR